MTVAVSPVPAGMWMFHVDVDGGVREHIMRGEHTLCGLPHSRYQWRDTTGHPGAVECQSCLSVPVGYATSQDITALGISYRQLDYWVEAGWLRPSEPFPGSGVRRVFPPSEYAVAQVMAPLVHALIAPAAAAHAARNGGWLDDRVRVDLKLGTSA